jgi:hypothetical protein
MKTMLAAALFAGFLLAPLAAQADDDATTTVKAHSAALDALAHSRDNSSAAMMRDLTDRSGDRTAPVVTQEENFDVQRLSQSAVQTVIAQHVEEVQACYEKVAGHSKTASGSVSLSFTVEASGKTSEISVEAPGMNVKVLSKCIVQRVKRWKFPTADAETPVEIPFEFGGMQ